MRSASKYVVQSATLAGAFAGLLVALAIVQLFVLPSDADLTKAARSLVPHSAQVVKVGVVDVNDGVVPKGSRLVEFVGGADQLGALVQRVELRATRGGWKSDGAAFPVEGGEILRYKSSDGVAARVELRQANASSNIRLGGTVTTARDQSYENSSRQTALILGALIGALVGLAAGVLLNRRSRRRRS